VQCVAALFLFTASSYIPFMAGYSGTPLVKKLGIKSNSRVYVFQSPAAYFDWLHPLPEDVTVKKELSKELDFIHLFVNDQEVFRQMFLKSKVCLKKDGVLWISWPKKSSKRNTDLDENIIREVGLTAGLVDVKVCAVDEVWSGLKFVFRVKDR
jgi:hypothetical protein